MFDFFKNWKSDLSYQVYFSKADRREVETLFSRVLNTEDGKKLLAYLQYITLHRALNENATNEQLRFIEGQRALVGKILKLTQNNKNTI